MKRLKITALAISLLLSFFAAAQTSFAIMTRGEMMTIAESYANHAWTPTENNVCSSKCCIEWDEEGKCSKKVACSVNTPDRNTNTDWSSDQGWKWEKDENGNYSQSVGVPYQWGGSSSIDVSGIHLKSISGFGDFDTGIENKKCAGDARDFGYKSNYAVGVDCSGFISRAWNLKYKQSTSTLPKISKRLEGLNAYDKLKEGDILNRIMGKESHVMLFNEFLDSESPHINLEVYESMGYYWKVKTSKYNIKNKIEKEGYLPRTSFPSEADVEIVIDASFSMWGENLEKAREAMNYFVNSYESNARIGVVGFSDSAAVIYPLTMLENSQIRSDIKETASDYLDSHFGGKTYIVKGLELARKELNKDANSNSPKVIILISDGYESPENISDPEYVSINDVILQIAQGGIVVHTVRMGWQTPFISPPGPEFVLASQENSSSVLGLETFQSNKLDYQAQSIIIIPDFDPSNFSEEQATAYLKMIAMETGGKNKPISNLESFLNTCRETVYDFYALDRTLKTIYGEISPNQTIYKEFFIDPSMETATFALFWPGSELDFSLIQPDGTEITSDSTRDDVSFSSSGMHKIYEIDAPMNGLWQFRIYGKEVSDDGEDYAISISGLSGIDLDVSFDKDKYSPNNPIKIFASVNDQILDIPEDQYVYGAEVKAEIKDPEENVYNINLYDADNDGIYTGEFLETSTIGQYDFTVEFNGISNVETSDPFTREKTISAVVTENVSQSARQLKQDTLTKIKIIQSDNKQAQNDIDKATEDIENSLEPELWINASRLDPKHGHKVFDREKQAIKNLLKIIEERGRHDDSKIAAELQTVIDNLVKADILLARTAIYDAESITVEDPKFQEKIDKEISKAKEELEKAFQEIANDNQDKAIDYLKRAWESAQIAVEFKYNK